MINHSMGNSISYTNACTACFLYHLIDLKERDCSLSTCRMMIDGYDLATIIADSFLISAARKEKKGVTYRGKKCLEKRIDFLVVKTK